MATTLWLVGAIAVPSSVLAQAKLDPDHASTANCIRSVLRADKAVDSISLYRIDGSRSAVEFTFRDEKYGTLVADIELNYVIAGDVGFDMGFLRTDATPSAEFQDKGYRAAEFVGRLQIAKKCSMTTALDDVFPPPKPRSEWQPSDWPSPRPSP